MGKSNSMSNISASDALVRSVLAPSAQFMVLGPTGSAKTTFVFNLLPEELSKYIKEGIGEVSHTTLIPCTFCFDDRIKDPNHIALYIDRKFIPMFANTESDSQNEYIMKTLFSVIQPILLGKFISNDYNPEETLSGITDDDLHSILEPGNGQYHLEFLLSDTDFYDECTSFSNQNIKTKQSRSWVAASSVSGDSSAAKDYSQFKELFRIVFLPILKYMEPRFKSELAQYRKDPKFHRTEISQLRELVFESLLDNVPDEDFKACRSLFRAIIKSTERYLENILGTDYYQTLYGTKTSNDMRTDDNIVQLSLSKKKDCQLLSKLFDPGTPLNLIVDNIYISCRPNESLNKSYPKHWKEYWEDYCKEHQEASDRIKDERYPLRFSITDTSFVSQTETSYPSLKESFESAFNQKTDCVFYLFSCESHRNSLIDSLKALKSIAGDFFKKNKEKSLHIIFTKADRILENIVFRNDASTLRMNFNDNMQKAIEKQGASKEIDNKIRELLTAAGIPDTSADADNISADWMSLRYIAGSSHFSPDYLFDKVSSVFFDIIKKNLIDKKDLHLYHILEPKDPAKPAISVNINKNSLTEGISKIQQLLTIEKDIVNGYYISPDKPTVFHAASVKTYFEKLRLGLGHSTKSVTYDNFSINMKGLIKRVILKVFPDFESLNKGDTLDFNIRNLSFESRNKLVSFIYNTEEEIPDDEIEERLSNAFLEVFDDPEVYKYIVNRIAYGLSFGNQKVNRRIALAYYISPGSKAMASMQQAFFDFFSSNSSNDDVNSDSDFPSVFIEELEKTLTEMLNYAFVVC